MKDNSFATINVPSMQEGPKLVGSTAWGDASQGWAVAVSDNGNTAVVGGPNDSAGTGALWVFTRSEGTWRQQGNKLVGNDCVGASRLGKSVAISGDGNTIVTGGSDDNNGIGAAWIFTRSGGVWTQQGGKLVGNDWSPDNPMQGAAVAMSRDGNVAVVGGDGDDFGIGATWVYTRSDGVWTQFRSKLIGSGYDGAAGQGSSLALSANRMTLIVGSRFEGSGNPPVWVFVKELHGWEQQGRYLTASDAVITQPAQRTAVAVSEDGSTFILGENCDNGLTGAVWFFSRTGEEWKQQGHKLVASGATAGAELGVSVSISGAGNVAVAGGNSDNNRVGAMWVFSNDSGPWAQKGNKLVGTGGSGPTLQGSSVSLSADGYTALSGGCGDSGMDGATWVFVAAEPAKT